MFDSIYHMTLKKRNHIFGMKTFSVTKRHFITYPENL